jgi:DNA-binding CsgD family transcriptional regulator
VGEADPLGSPSGPGVVGRAEEQARIVAFLGAVAGGAHALLVRGEPGIGKTTLWRDAVEEWRRAGRVVLVTRPAEEERSLALGGLVDLFEDAEIDPVALEAGDDPIARGRAVLSALRELGAKAPTLVAVDDVQWVDAASARALRYAIRRLDAEPVGLLATARGGAEDPLGAAALLPPGRGETLDLGPLTLEALRTLLGDSFGAIPRPALRHIFEISEGNPLFALELARGLAKVDPALRSTSGPPLPESLQEAIAVRLDTVPADLLPLLETLSALGRASVAELREAVPATDVDRQLEMSRETGLIIVSDDLDVRFSHPLVGSVVYERMSPLGRRSLHARLADAAGDPDLRARHLAFSLDEPDAEVALLLEEAAGRAVEQGSHDVAAELAGHSLRLTPPDDEEGRRRRALAEAAQLAAAGEMSRALRLADALVAEAPPGPERVELLVQRAQLEGDDIETGEALLVRALADAGADEVLRGRVLDQLGWLRGVFRGDLPAGIECAREALSIAERLGDHEFVMSAAAGLSNMEALAGNPRPELMERAVGLELEHGRPALWAGPRVLYSEQHLWAGDLPGARALLEAAAAEAARSRNERWTPYSLYDLAAVESAAGNLALADELLRRAMEAARDAEDAHVESWVFYRLALVATWLGRAEEARAAAQRRLDRAGRLGERPGIARARSVLGLLALSEGDAQRAALELTEAVELLAAMGFAHPGAIPALPDLIEALALTGEVDAAGELLARLEEQAAGVASVWTGTALERSRGVVLLARGEPEGAAELLAVAESAFSELGYEPDGARALLLEGRALLRAGRRTAAADALAAARERFTAMGAVLWAARAADELERAAPGRAAGELTPIETRIARLVADGKKNREIGEALFISVATVEAHLTRIYRKLSIRSRSELTRLVAEGTLPVAGQGRE